MFGSMNNAAADVVYDVMMITIHSKLFFEKLSIVLTMRLRKSAMKKVLASHLDR